MNDLERAIALAVEAHIGDTDKAGETYIRHPLRVMHKMETRTERVVAILHDVVEDTRYTLEDIDEQFGPEVRDAVDALTKREEEKGNYSAFIERAATNPIARRVKLADIEDNMDLRRLDEVDENILKNQRKYHRAWHRLQTQDLEPLVSRYAARYSLGRI